MAKPNVLYATSRPARHRDIALQAAPADVHVVMCSSDDPDELRRHLPDADFLISERALTIDAKLLEAAGKLRLIQRIGRLTHDIDMRETTGRGIRVCYLPVERCAKVAEHAMMQMLMLQRNYRRLERLVRTPSDRKPARCDANTFAYNWAEADVKSMLGAVVGIVGFGEIGAELSLRLQPFGGQVLYHKRSRLPAHAETALGVRYEALDDMLGKSDVVVILLPHSSQTEGSVDSRFIARMKRGAMLVATGASTALNEWEVAEAYRSGAIGGVATDGWNYEPVEPDNPLVRLADDPESNVVFTPHVAAGSGVVDWTARQAEYANIVRALRGEPLLNERMAPD